MVAVSPRWCRPSGIGAVGSAQVATIVRTARQLGFRRGRTQREKSAVAVHDGPVLPAQSPGGQEQRHGHGHGMREGWYPCPSGAAQVRYWDGTSWTDQTRPDLLGWVHGPRVLDLPGVFAFGRDPDADGSGRPGPLDPTLWRRVRNALIALPILYIALILPAGYLLTSIGLSTTAAQIVYLAVLVFIC